MSFDTVFKFATNKAFISNKIADCNNIITDCNAQIAILQAVVNPSNLILKEIADKQTVVSHMQDQIASLTSLDQKIAELEALSESDKTTLYTFYTKINNKERLFANIMLDNYVDMINQYGEVGDLTGDELTMAYNGLYNTYVSKSKLFLDCCD